MKKKHLYALFTFVVLATGPVNALCEGDAPESEKEGSGATESSPDNSN